MHSSRTTRVLVTGLTAALTVTLLAAAPAAASGRTILRDTFAGNVPLTATDPTPVFTTTTGVINPAGRGWVLDEGSRVRVREDGRITVSIRGLIFDNGDPNTVGMVAASVVCGDVVVSTLPFALSIPEGNAQTHQRVDLPEDCADPVVLIRSATNPAALGNYFAYTTDDDDHH